MKFSSGLFFLLVLLIFNTDQQEAREISSSSSGRCVDICRGHWDCDNGEFCITRGCGHFCSDRI
ncbi:protein Wfdc21-like [Macrotis lagotis]|uniref:protein Wfdc21-like n=1 Tax=Macrotis lagotis TaxID=92651 RepID=UPI003D692765